MGRNPPEKLRDVILNEKSIKFFEPLPKLRSLEGVGRVVLLRLQFYHSLLQIFRLSSNELLRFKRGR